MKSKTYSLALTTLVVMLLSSVGFSQYPVGRPDPPKADDATRVGLVTPRVSLLGGGGSVPQETSSLRQGLSSFLTGPRIGTVDLKAKLDTLALEEGKERGCDYVLFVALTRKRQSAARGAGATYGSGGSKSGDEFIFEYKVVPTGGTQGAIEKTLRATATADGQDVLTPMIETTAQVVVGLARVARPATESAEAKVNAEPVVTPEPTVKSKNEKESIPTGYGSLTATPKGATTSRTKDPPKAEGTIRIGIVTPRMNVAGGGMSGNSEVASLREMLNSYLSGSNIETIDLKARLEGLALTEAQKRDCDFVLYTTLLRKRNASPGRGSGTLNSIMGNVGGSVGTKVPGSKTAQDITSEAAKVSSTISSLARANDEVTFEYRLVTSVGARPVVAKSTKAKVKEDREDVLTPMVESAAQAIVDATVKN